MAREKPGGGLDSTPPPAEIGLKYGFSGNGKETIGRGSQNVIHVRKIVSEASETFRKIRKQ